MPCTSRYCANPSLQVDELKRGGRADRPFDPQLRTRVGCTSDPRRGPPGSRARLSGQLPTGTGAADLAEAEAEIDATFAGQFGILRFDASYVAERDGHAVGAILVTERSIWDEIVPGPFVIDLFLSPVARGTGTGKGLVQAAMRACHCSGDQTLALRVGEGTSASALGIYRRLGFIDYTEIATAEHGALAGGHAPVIGERDGRTG